MKVKFKKSIIVFMFLLAFVFMLSACMGDGSFAADTSSPQSTDVEDTAPISEAPESPTEIEAETEKETDTDTDTDTETDTETETETYFSCEEGYHNEVLHEAKAVSCTEAGWDAYVSCRDCDYTTRTVIQKSAHEYGPDGKCACGAEKWEAPQNATVRYATDVSAVTPSIDGKITLGEYGTRFRVNSPRVINLDQRKLTSAAVDTTLASEYMDFYFAYDADYIYIAIRDAGPEFINNGDSYTKNDIPYRHNYRFEFGFDLENPNTYFMFNGGSTVSAWDDLRYCQGNSGKVISLKTYELISDSIIHKYKTDSSGTMGDYISFGDVGAVNGNVNYTDSKWAVVMELKLDKKVIIELLNETYGTEYENLSDAMWFSLSTNGYKAKDNNLDNVYPSQNVRWIGQNDQLVDLVVFGNKDAEIAVADPYPVQNFCPNGHLLTFCEGREPTYDEVGFKDYEVCGECGYTTYVELPKIEGIFRTGYERADITPPVSSTNPFGAFTDVRDNIYATCVAVSDGEKTVILVSIDMGSISEAFNDQIRAQINKVTGVPTDHIFISATHSHSSTGFGTDSRWALDAFRKIGDAAAAAIADLSDTEMYIGTGKTTGMAWVRRYIDGKGNMSSVNPANFWDTSTRSVSEADDTLQAVRFIRDDKKDIVLINWQAHLAHAVNHFPNSISADIAHYLREDVEAGDDVLIAYFAGASGNINLGAPNYSLTEYANESNPKYVKNYYVNVAHALAKVVLDTIKDENLTRIESGRIMVERRVYTAQQKQDSKEEVAAAQARLDAGGNGAGDRYMVARNKSKTRDLRLSALSFGEFGLVTVPYEMFDTNGMQVKEQSPFKMTFVLTNADGDFAYVPSYEACTEYGGYETEATYFGAGVAERVVEQLLVMLSNLHKQY